MRAWLPALIITSWAAFAALQSGCAELWQGFGEPNPSSCVTGGAICPEGTICVASAGLCMAPEPSRDGALPDGGTPSQEDLLIPETGSNLHAVWGADTNDVWIVGDQGRVLHWDGTALSTVTTPIRVGLRSVHGPTNGNRTIVGGEKGEIWEYVRSMGTWTQITTSTQVQIRSLSIDSMTQWAVGDAGICLERTSSGFVQRFCPISGSVHAVSINLPNILIVGEGGAIGFREGPGWSSELSGTTTTLRATTSIGSQYWAVGDPDGNGWVLLRRSSSGAWMRSTGPAKTPRMLYGVFARSMQDVWAVGDERTLLRYDGSQWSSHTCPITRSTGRSFLGIWADTSSNQAWAVGKNGLICRWNGTSWSEASL